MLLRNDSERCNVLRQIIKDYYGENRTVSFRGYSGVDSVGESETVFLLDRKYVIKYSVGYDRGVLLGALSLAIGPLFFSPADFWSYEDSKKFKIEVDEETIIHNLNMLDDFINLKDLKNF